MLQGRKLCTISIICGLLFVALISVKILSQQLPDDIFYCTLIGCGRKTENLLPRGLVLRYFSAIYIQLSIVCILTNYLHTLTLILISHQLWNTSECAAKIAPDLQKKAACDKTTYIHSCWRPQNTSHHHPQFCLLLLVPGKNCT